MAILERCYNCLAIKDNDGQVIETFDFNEYEEAQLKLIKLNSEKLFYASFLYGENYSRRELRIKAIDVQHALEKIYSMYNKKYMRDLIIID